VETASLQVSPGIDRHIQPLKASLSGPFDTVLVERFLHSSPEFAMKKLLAAGEQKIFQICHVFRDKEEGSLHHPEFTMLEWYRVGETYEALMEDVVGLVATAASAVKRDILRHGSCVVELDRAWRRLTIAEAFREFAGIDVLAEIPDPEHSGGGNFITVARASGVRCEDDDSWDDVFHRIMLGRIEPSLSNGPPVFLTDYPSPVGALARPNQLDPRVCERVEAYVCGLELANGFSELRDPDEQRRRFERDRAVFAELYGEPPPIDEDFLSALAHMPDSAGMALGIDRLVMLLTGADHIRDVLWSPVDMGN
jgi:elongation factor P--(R)-beta-lysine ligase